MEIKLGQKLTPENKEKIELTLAGIAVFATAIIELIAHPSMEFTGIAACLALAWVARDYILDDGGKTNSN